MDGTNVVALRLLTLDSFDRSWILKRLSEDQSKAIQASIALFEKQFGGKLKPDLKYQISELLEGYSFEQALFPDSEELENIDLDCLSDLYLAALRRIVPGSIYAGILSRLPNKRRKSVMTYVVKHSSIPLSNAAKSLLIGSLTQLLRPSDLSIQDQPVNSAPIDGKIYQSEVA